MTRDVRSAVLGAVTFSAVLASGGTPPWIPGACLLGVGLSLALDRRGRRLPDVATKLAALGLGILFLLPLLFDADADFRRTLLAFLSPLMLLLLSGRDESLAVLVSLVLVVLSVAGTEGLVPVGITGVYLAAVSAVLASLARRAPPGGASRVVVRVAAGRWSGAARLLPYPLALAGLLCGFVLYLLVPRVSDGPGVADTAAAEELARSREERRGAAGGTHATTGFPERIRIGDVGAIQRDPRVAFVASVGSRGRPYDPEPEDRSALLLRARAWDVYDLGRGLWSRGGDGTLPVPDSGRIAEGDATFDWTMSLRGYDGHVLFLPQGACVVRAPGSELLADRLGTVRSRAAVRQYSVEAAAPLTRLADLRGQRAAASERALLHVPRSLRARLAEMVEPQEDLADAVAEVADSFHRGGFRYTLTLPDALPGEGDPLSAFLDRREGHCELFATLGCLLLRQIGVPARLAGGVRLSERVEPGVYLARYRNAHAWVEIACEGQGFVAVDFTPPDAGPPGPLLAAATGVAPAEAPAPLAPPAPVDWRNPFRYGYLEQRRLARWFGGALDGVPVLPLLLAAAAVPLAGLFLRLRRRRARSPLRVAAAPGVPRRALAFYARWLRSCASRGHVRRHAQTPREFLAGLPRELQAEGAAITAQFERLRYGGA